jgi:hypothetical protein
MPTLLAFVEALAYGFARGWWKAYFELKQRGEHAWEETTIDEDRARADRFRDAARAAGLPPGGPSDSQPHGPTSVGG